MLELEVLVLELLTVDGLATGTVAVGEVAALVVEVDRTQKPSHTPTNIVGGAGRA
jgi:hypothetical protein